MNLADGVADLHIHTTASDGTSTVTERVEQARERGLDAIALTDHDCIAESRSEPVTHHAGLEVITGVEVRADVRSTKVEILGYYVDPTDDDLEDVLEQTREFRRERNRSLVENVRRVTDLDVEYDELVASTDGMLGRPHIAEALVDGGVVDSIGAAFERYLGNDGAAYVPMNRLPAATVVETIQGAGGVASLAHPGRIRTENVRELLETLESTGLDAIEVKYPYDDAPSEGYADVGIDDATALAAEFNLLETGGSDCHGPDSGKFRIGDVRVGSDALDAIRRVANKRSSS